VADPVTTNVGEADAEGDTVAICVVDGDEELVGATVSDVDTIPEVPGSSVLVVAVAVGIAVARTELV
jgi:hypothetical protein